LVYQLILQEEAIEDARSAYTWYEDQLPGLGEDFLAELDKVFEKLKQHPQHYSYVFDDFRDVHLNRFPYLVVFKIEGKKIYINSIKHSKRKPSSDK
jgi:toxin ParE1/3/4